MAVESRLLRGEKKSISAISIQQRAATMLGSTEVIQALLGGPWASDACSDIAHGYLTARLAHPDLDKQDYCAMYKHDLSTLRSGTEGPKASAPANAKSKALPTSAAVPPQASHAGDVQKLRKR